MRKNQNKSFYHYKLVYKDGSYKRYMTIKDIEKEYNISNFTIHKCIRNEITTRKCPEIVSFIKEKYAKFLLVPNNEQNILG
tara:strand:- start:262 stop:504 length:243 start_codon:yes stop_codon:yes gene_type:complete